ncbi:hypothetical protein DFH09DRAFT_1073339 [Mycena vulgaris]|nr:hypothetical protein DFH09DRAFT_1073339 [Mycena vulgaris]
MRGTERPASVRWTRPFLTPLKPLRQDAARQIFIDIADDSHDSEDIDKVLLLTDNMPLAINLMAHLVDSEGCSNVLARWEQEKTSVVSSGYDKRSNLDLSISVSLSSPQITSFPHCQQLLSLLSMLPDGLSDIELAQSRLPIKDILSCKVALLSTSLAYSGDQRRVQVLVPIREYMQKYCPPMAHLVQPLNPAAVDKIYCIMYLNTFSRLAGHGRTPLMDHITHIQLPSHELEVYLITEILSSWSYHPIVNPEALLNQGIEKLPHFDDSEIKCITGRFYNVVGQYYRSNNNIPAATNYYQTGLSLAVSTGNTRRQCQLSIEFAYIGWDEGDHTAGLIYASEAQRLAKISADLYTEAQALNIRAMCWFALGNYKYAASFCDRAKDLLAHCGMSGSDIESDIMTTQAEIHKLKSEYVEAQNIQRRVLHGVTIELDPYSHTFALLNVADLDVLLGAPVKDVKVNIDTAQSIFNSFGQLVSAMMCDTTMGSLCLRERNLQPAKTIFYKCLTLSRGKQAELVNYCLERLGNGSLWDSTDWSSSWTIVYLVQASKSNQKLDVLKALQYIGDIFQADGDWDTAVSLLTVALEGFTWMDVHRSRAECMLRLGDISKREGNMVQAMKLWTTARPLFERSTQTKQIALIDERLTGITNLEDNKMNLASLSHLHAPTGWPKESSDTTIPMENLVLIDEDKDAASVPI